MALGDDWPLILAGPILRRVEPRRVSVWVALSAARTVTLHVFQGIVAGSGAGLITSPAPVYTGSRTTMGIGPKLHICVVSAEMPAGNPLQPGTVYSYNLQFSPFDQPPPPVGLPDTDLQTLAILRDESAGPRPHLALGYVPNQLPSFATPPPDLRDLIIAHGSCRKPHGWGMDAMPILDKLIGREPSSPTKRPHYLFLTGDQIYADDVALPLLPMLSEAGAVLIQTIEKISTNEGQFVVCHNVLPAGRRQRVMDEKAKFTSEAGDSHLIAFREFCAMYLFVWSNVCWPDDLPRQEDVLGLALSDKLPAAAILTKAEPSSDAEGYEQLRKKLQREWRRQLPQLKQFRDGLPRVRRALANVPTLMIFDDHEVTDDWYITREWRDRVLTAPLGVAIMRNALAAYALFQAWGNDPPAFEQGLRQELLETIISTYLNLDIDMTAAGRLATLFGLDLTIDELPEPPPVPEQPPITWHYRLSGGQYDIAVLDTRTRRVYQSRFTPPQLLSEAALRAQVPELPSSNAAELLIVIAPAPVLGVQVFEELIQPISGAVFDIIHRITIEGERQNGTPQDETRLQLVGAMKADIEAWAFNAVGFEALLARLQPHGRVLILSGDVHYGLTSALDYWKGAGPPVRYVQVVCSAYQNQNDPVKQFLLNSGRLQQALGRGFLPAARLGWRNELGLLKPLNVPGGRVSPRRRGLLRRTPLVIPAHDWPAGTTLSQPAEWRWLLRILADERPDEGPTGRPDDVAPDPLTPDADPGTTAGYARTLEHYVVAQEKANTRRIVWNNNAALIRFERAVDGLYVRHEIYYRVEDEEDEDLPVEPYTLHRARLEPTAELPPELNDARLG